MTSTGQILSEISKIYAGTVVNDSAQFQISVCHFKVWFSQANVNTSEQESGSDSPASSAGSNLFSIRCQLAELKDPTNIFVRIRNIKDIGNDFDMMSIASILDQGFNEVDIGSGWIEIRQTNAELSDKQKLIQMASVCPTLPGIIQPA